MTNFDIFLVAFSQIMRQANSNTIHKPDYLEISGALARDPEVKKHLQIDGQRGEFLSIPVHVVADVTPIYLEKSPK